PRKRRTQRADALRRDNRNEPSLPRQRERALVAGRVGLTDRGEGVVLVADKQQVPPDAIGLRGDLRDALEHRSLEIELQHYPENARQPRVHAHGKVERQYAAALEQRVERRERLRLAWRGFFGIGAARRAERAVHGRTVIEKREKDDDPFRDRGPEPVVEPAPPVQVPALYGLELVS